MCPIFNDVVIKLMKWHIHVGIVIFYFVKLLKINYLIHFFNNILFKKENEN
jgi:hypothetical protein